MNETRLSLALPAGTVLRRGRDRYILGGVTGFGGTSLFYTAKKEGSNLPFGIKECCPAEMTRYLRREGGVLTGVSTQTEHALEEARKRMMRETEISRDVAAVSAQTIPVWEAPRNFAVETAAGRAPAPAGSFLILRDMSSVGMFLPQLLEECALPPADGHPLRTGGRPHIHTAACILEQALQALELVHKAGYLYGDMQVQNVFFAGTRPEKGKIGLACLLDFGCARPLADRVGGGQETARIEDRMVFSTPGYTAPEILWHNDGNLRLTPAADVYSAGRLLLFLLRGRTYFENGRDRLLTEQASLGCVLPYEGERLGCSARSLRLLQRILDRSLEPEREKRYQTAAAMLEEVEELAWMTRSPTDRLSLACPALPDEEFLPRDEKLAEIDRCLFQRCKPAVVWGFAGMGKTELVLKFRQRYTRGQAYFVRFRDSVRETVTGPIADAFSGYDRRDVHGREKPEEQIYREVMKLLGERSENDLLILDNMDGDEGGFDVLRGEPAFRDLCALPMGLLVTTRSLVEDGVEVDTLPQPLLRQLLRRFAPDLSDEMADALINAVEGHTLTVELMGRTLKTSIPRLSPEVLLEKLTLGDLDSKALAKVSSPKDREGRMERIQGHLTALFRLSDLSEKEKQMLGYALPMSEAGLAAEDFAQVPDFDQDVLLRLIDRGWIRRSKDDILTMHPLVQEIGLGEAEVRVRALFDFSEAMTFKIVTNYGVSDAAIGRVLGYLGNLYVYSGRGPTVKTLSGMRIQQILLFQGRYRLALKWARKLLEWLEAHPDKERYPKCMRTALRSCADCMEALGQAEEAAVFREKAELLSARIPEAPELENTNEIYLPKLVGGILRERLMRRQRLIALLEEEQYPAVIRQYEEDRSWFLQNGMDTALLDGAASEAYEALGEHAKAVRALRDACAGMEQWDRPTAVCLHCLVRLAEYCSEDGTVEEGRTLLLRALDVLEQLFPEERGYILRSDGATIIELAEVNGWTEEAAAWQKLATELENEIGSDEPDC